MKRSVTAFISAVLLGSASVVPAQASPEPAPAHIVALGDSYGAGVGASDYEPITEGNCWRSRHSTAQVVADTLLNAGYPVEFTNVTCSGATINDLRRPYHGVVQLNALRLDTLLVVLQVGGNDIGFADVVTQCLAPNTSCTNGAIQKARKMLPLMGANLFVLLQQIKARSPQARIVLLGYGQPMTTGPNAGAVPLDPVCGPEYFTPAERQEGGRLSADLDLALRLTVKTAKYYGDVDVTYISPYDSSKTGGLDHRFAGRSLCEAAIPEQLYRGFDALAPLPVGDPARETAILHMNKTGYAVLAEILITEAPGRGALAALTK